MRIAAIDIGSNAIRFRVVEVFEHETGPVFKKIENVRFPLRLGQDVFNFFKIAPDTEEKLLKLMQAYRSLLELYDVQHYLAFATSALREAENGKEIIKKMASVCRMQVSLISGEQEAELINLVVGEYIDDGCNLHIDVGGGSTELNFYRNRVCLSSSSHRMGAVRQLRPGEKQEITQTINHWLQPLLVECPASITALGTGGNINALLNYSKVKKKHSMSIKTLKATHNMLAGYSVEERVSKLDMAEDRADVIIPGGNIYLSIMQLAGANRIIVPGIGLIDGIIRKAWEQYMHRLR